LQPGPQAEPVAIGDGRRRVVLKWHQLRRAAGDPPWSLANLRSGLAAGASLEIDVRTLADRAWVCLHDKLLDEETNGRGAVDAIDATAVGDLKVAGANYPPPLLTDVANAIAAVPERGGCVQLDLKASREQLSGDAVDRFAAAVAPVARRCLLSGTDWAAVQVLGEAVPALRLGFDPLDLATGRRFGGAQSYAEFVDDVVATAPNAAAFYIHYRFLVGALACGLNPVPSLKSNGAIVDAWTLDATTPGIDGLLAQMAAAGVDQITTNDPLGIARHWRSSGSGT